MVHTNIVKAGPPASNWGETFTIDSWGNLTNIAPYAGKTHSETLNCAPANTSNQLNTCFAYDSAGNLTQNGSTQYTYDAENRLVSSSGWNYVYDGDGQRVKKSNGSAGTLYWRNLSGETLDESDLSGNVQEEYVYFNGQKFARRDISTNAVHYYFSDHLGSHSLVTDSSGNIQNESDYYPYGGEMIITNSDPLNHHKFTGKERDAESGLDNFGARYNASSMGRFMTPDPKILSIRHIINPQKWNKYAYTINNPLRYFDPNGMEEIEVQLRSFIQANTRTDPGGRIFAGDSRGFSSAPSASSRTSITVRIETDASKRPGNPIISITPGSAGETRQLDANGNIINRATATTGLPTVTGSRDANGNAVLNFQENTKNPLEPQSVTPPISANLTTTITQNGLSEDTTGTVSGAPSFELNVGSTNIPLQSEPSSNIGFDLGLFQTNSIKISTPLPPEPPPPPPCATDKEKPC
jgi:RHS repeat-associated protein